MKKQPYSANYTKLSPELHRVIAQLYKAGKHTTQQLADIYDVQPRTIQRIAKKHGVLRSLAESNRIVAPLKHYHHIPQELRVKRKGLTLKLRYKTISEHPYCKVCGRRPDEGIRLEIDHKDNNPSNNDENNLQVLCSQCNAGKSHLDRFS